MSSSVSLEYLNQILPTSVPTQQSMSAQNTAGGAILVILGGTPVPLPTRPYINGFTASGDNTTFTVTNTGTYYIQYNVQTTLSLAMSSSVYRNGAVIPNLTRSGLTGSTFSGSAIVPLNAGDTLSLTLYGLAGTATLQGGAGATMNIIRIA